MASRYANMDAQKSLKRMNGDLNISQAQKDRIVDIATAHLAAGNVGDFSTAIAAVGKADVMNDESDRLERMEARMTHNTRTDNRLEHFVDNDIEQLKADKAMLESRIAALEAK